MRGRVVKDLAEVNEFYPKVLISGGEASAINSPSGLQESDLIIEPIEAPSPGSIFIVQSTYGTFVVKTYEDTVPLNVVTFGGIPVTFNGEYVTYL